MIERFGDNGELREALLGRAWLPSAIRADLAAITADQLANFAVARNWMSRGRSERLAKDSRETAAMIIAAGCAAYSGETAALTAYLRAAGQLTPGLALRALLCGQTGLFEAMLVELTDIGPRRIAGLIKDPASTAFAAVYVKAGLPPVLLPAFGAALAALTRFAAPDEADCLLRLPIIEAALRVCTENNVGQFDQIVALLRRFEAEASRQQGREGVAAIQKAAQQSRSEAPAYPATKAATPTPQAKAEPPLAAAAPVAPDEAKEPEITIDLLALEAELMAA
jgi:uncharacterized protein (DUF2336 family)